MFWNKKKAEPVPQVGAEEVSKLGGELFRTGDTTRLGEVEAWFSDPEFPARMGEAVVCRFLILAVSTIDRDEPERRERLRELTLRAVRSFDPAQCPVRQDTSDRYLAECILLRHMGKHEEGVKLALAGLSDHGTAYCALFAGLCYMDMDEVERAEEYMHKTLEMDPGLRSGCNDLADYFFNRRRYAKAAEYYTLALEGGDGEDCAWAEPALLYCRYRLGGDALDLERLISCGALNSGDGHIAHLCDMARQDQLVPYVDYLKESTEACINLLRSIRERGADLSGGSMATNCLEAPSATNAVRLEAGRYGEREVSYTFTASAEPEPPISVPSVPDGMVLWSFDRNFDASPVVARPSERVAALVKGLAQRDFALADWYERAGTLAQGLTAEDRDCLYGAMVFPPRPDGEARAENWLLRCQYAAVCLLARLGGTYLTVTSDRLKAYASLLTSPELAYICLGQLDWPVIPALTLLAYEAREGLTDADAAAALLKELLRRVGRGGSCFFEHALLCALCLIPGQDRDFYARMWEQRLELEEY